jgi:hypothetical protein
MSALTWTTTKAADTSPMVDADTSTRDDGSASEQKSMQQMALHDISGLDSAGRNSWGLFQHPASSTKRSAVGHRNPHMTQGGVVISCPLFFRVRNLRGACCIVLCFPEPRSDAASQFVRRSAAVQGLNFISLLDKKRRMPELILDCWPTIFFFKAASAT